MVPLLLVQMYLELLLGDQVSIEPIVHQSVDGISLGPLLLHFSRITITAQINTTSVNLFSCHSHPHVHLFPGSLMLWPKYLYVLSSITNGPCV